MSKRSIAVMILLETNDPRLFPENLNNGSAKSTAAVRVAVIRNLKNLTRVVMVCDEELAKAMCAGHVLAAQASGMDVSDLFPPAAYVAPTRD